jgi:hypothetical protein
VRSTVLPRSTNAGLARTTLRVTRLAFRLWVGRSAAYERRDRIMAMLGPMALLGMLATWLLLTLVGFSLLYLAAGARSVTAAVELSGSSVFTLGTTQSRGLGSDALSYLEAGIGLLLVTLLITYLPSIYSAFSRREIGVNLLRVRAGEPPRAATLLIRYHLIGDAMRLGSLWQSWEAWFTDVEETHTTFAVLPFFRSPQAQQSWITAAGALLDAASMWVAAIEHERDPDAQLCIRSGFQTLRRIASVYGLDTADDPGPDDPISVSRQEWDQAVDEMAGRGVPIVADRDAAWAAWRGWRVNYDNALLTLARFVEAPPAPWVSDRSPIGSERTRRLLGARRKVVGGDGDRRGGGRGARRRSRRRVPLPPDGDVAQVLAYLDAEARAVGDGDGPVGAEAGRDGHDVVGPETVGG